MPATTAKVPGEGAGTLSYTIPGDGLDLESVYAVIDNSAGASAVTAELTLQDQSGVVIARKKQGATIPAGGSGSATWALRLDDEGGATAGTTGIFYEVDNEDGWLEIGASVSIPSGDVAPSAIGLKDSGAGGGIGLWDGNFGGGVTIMAGPKGGNQFGFGGIQLLAQSGGVTISGYGSVAIFGGSVDVEPDGNITARAVTDLTLSADRNGAGAGNLYIQNLPTSAAGLPSGAVWNNGGVLSIV